jgi:CheY-like chemotaxis protein
MPSSSARPTSAALELVHLEDGEAALAYLHDRDAPDSPERPHLILLDLRLPRIDGLEVLREIKSSPDLSDIPCVVLTTSRAEGDMVKAYRLHANSYLVKPGSYESFVALMAGGALLAARTARYGGRGASPCRPALPVACRQPFSSPIRLPRAANRSHDDIS